MPKAKQLTVPCENRSGALAHIAKVLGDAKVNILAFLTTTSGAEGLTHIVVDRPSTAKQALAKAGLAWPTRNKTYFKLSFPIRLERWRSSPASSLMKTSRSR